MRTADGFKKMGNGQGIRLLGNQDFAWINGHGLYMIVYQMHHYDVTSHLLLQLYVIVQSRITFIETIYAWCIFILHGNSHVFI